MEAYPTQYKASAPNSSADAQTNEPGLTFGSGKHPYVLIVHASAGSGHRSAAYAIAQAFELLRNEGACNLPEGTEIVVEDIFDHGRIAIDGNKTVSMFTGPTRPIYDLTWRFTFTGRLLWGGGTIWSHTMFAPFTKRIAAHQPLAAICTHITAANAVIAARMLCNARFPVVCVPTDYETEGLWPHFSSDLFCVATESMAETLRPRKVEEERILITGIPVRESFRHEYNRSFIRQKYGIPKNSFVVLVLAGAHLQKPYVHFRNTLEALLPSLGGLSEHVHLCIVCGKDTQYAQSLRQQIAHFKLNQISILEYVEDIAALMNASDLAICKSGGLTVTECLCARLPMILLGHAYGQEKINTQTLTSAGAALHVSTARELFLALLKSCKQPESIRSMLINANFMRHPDAARNIAKASINLINNPARASSTRYKKYFLHFYWGKKPAHLR